MIVKAKKGLAFKVQGIKVTPDKEVAVSVTHDVLSKLREGSLIDMATIKAPQVIVPKPQVPNPKMVIPKPKPPKITKKPESKTVNKGEK